MGVFLSRQTVKDAGMSALVYQGTYPGMAARFSHTGRVTQEVGVRGAFGKLYGSKGSGAMQSKVFGFDYSILFTLRKTGRTRFELGATLDNYLHLREQLHYVNNRDYYECISSIGPTARYSYIFSWRGKQAGKNWEVNTRIFCPVGAALSTAYSAYEGQAGLHTSSLRTITRDIKLTSWNGLNRFYWNTGIKVRMRKGSGLSLHYQWEYYRIKEVSEVQSAMHSLTINYFFLL
ncbi:hypothetical protein AB6805_01625 [Chitinophaga sp. RCC_12]